MSFTALWAPGAPRPPPTRLLRLVRCQTVWGRWALALVLFLVAFGSRWLIDDIADPGPFLTFLPAIALVTLFCGRWPAVAVMLLGAVAGLYFWIPPIGFDIEWPTTPASLAVFVSIGLFELILIDTLFLALHDNREEQGRLVHSLRLRETIVQEMRHRVANQLQVITAMLEGSQLRIENGAPPEDVLEQAIGRISSITYLQQIVDNASNYERGLDSLLREVLDHIFYDVDVAVQVRTAPLELSGDQMTLVCLIVIEGAMNSLKHIFRRRRGHMFAVELRSLADERLVLTMWDDGPGFDARSALAQSGGLGLSIMHGLARELGGQLSLSNEGGTTVKVEFVAA